MSGIPGPGRILGKILSAGGRHLERALDRAAVSLGYGPAATIRDLVMLLQEDHCRTETHRRSNDPENYIATRSLRYHPDPDEFVQELVGTVSNPCRDCRMPVPSSLAEIGSEFHAMSAQLLAYTR